MEYQRGHFDLRKQVPDVDHCESLLQAHGIVGRCRDSLQLVEPLVIRSAGAGIEQRSEHLAKGRVILAPTLASECQHCFSANDFFRQSAHAPASCIAAEQYESAYPFGMPRSIDNGHTAALRNTEEIEAADPCSVDYTFQIIDERFK